MSELKKLPLKNLMGARGLTVSQFANSVGVSLPTVNNWRNGYTMPNAKYIPKIEETLGVSFHDIIWTKTP